ncbi:MAG: DUF21 domain-containing protein [Planctomycetaceae bacterium]|nr:DUF21 domain-containing protein [Planctomycetaceae bacterium]
MNQFLDSASLWLPGILVMTAIVFGSAFFSGSETALFYLSRDDLRRMRSGHAGERLAATLLKDPDRLLTTVLFWNLVLNLAYFSVSLVTAKRLLDAGQPTAAGVLSFGGLVGIIIFGEVAPKSAAVLFCRPIAVLASLPLSIAAKVLDPVLPFLGATTRAMRRIGWPHLKPEPYLEVDDIERAVETSELGVELVRIEQQILGRILELSDMTAEEIMRPRGTYQLWQPPVHLRQIRERGTLPEFLLIAGEDRDTVSFAVDLYDQARLPDENLEKLAEKVVYVPWCATASDTLAKIRSSLVSVATVINEYGETIGIVTEDDILDTLLNPQSSRGKRLLEREPVVMTGDGEIIADGLATLRYLAQRLDIDYDIEDGAPVTVAALIHDELERFPEVGDICRWTRYDMVVIHAGEPGDPIQVRLQPTHGSISDGTDP